MPNKTNLSIWEPLEHLVRPNRIQRSNLLEKSNSNSHGDILPLKKPKAYDTLCTTPRKRNAAQR
jgi:hypothetical protein